MPGVLCNRDMPEIANSVGNPREQARKGAGVGEDFVVLEKHQGACAIARAATVGIDGRCGVECSRGGLWSPDLTPCLSQSRLRVCGGCYLEAELGQV